MPVGWQEAVIQKSSSEFVPARIYGGAETVTFSPLVVYFHGGAFADECRGIDRPIARWLAEAGARVLVCDYGAISGNKFPETLDVAFSALEYIERKRSKFASKESPLVVAGDESGGNIAAGLVLKARDQMAGAIAGQILLSPLLDPFMSSLSIRDYANTVMRERWTSGWSSYLSKSNNACHPYAAPFYCSRMMSLPRTLVVTSQDDPLCDEALIYGERVANGGAMLTKQIFPAGAGWPDIYREREIGQPPWSKELRVLFQRFFAELAVCGHRHGARISI